MLNLPKNMMRLYQQLILILFIMKRRKNFVVARRDSPIIRLWLWVYL